MSKKDIEGEHHIPEPNVQEVTAIEHPSGHREIYQFQPVGTMTTLQQQLQQYPPHLYSQYVQTQQPHPQQVQQLQMQTQQRFTPVLQDTPSPSMSHLQLASYHLLLQPQASFDQQHPQYQQQSVVPGVPVNATSSSTGHIDAMNQQHSFSFQHSNEALHDQTSAGSLPTTQQYQTIEGDREVSSY